MEDKPTKTQGSTMLVMQLGVKEYKDNSSFYLNDSKKTAFLFLPQWSLTSKLEESLDFSNCMCHTWE